MTPTNSAVAASNDRELVVTRVFDAPRALVFEAWTDPEHLMHWWAPKGWTTPFLNVDFRPGGVFHYCMRSPEGHDTWGIGIYREIVEPERIVFTDSFADAEGNPVPPSTYGMSASHPSESLVTVTFAEEEGKTRLTLRHTLHASVKERGGAQQGWIEMLDRLADELADREIVTTRVFDAPRERVFGAFGNPDHLAHWWGPNGFTNTFHEFDLRPGGIWRFTMHGPDGVDYQNESVFTEVTAPERIVFQHREPIHQFQMTMTFAEQSGKTKLTWRMRFDSAEEYTRVKTLVAEANEQNFDRLEQHLAINEREAA